MSKYDADFITKQRLKCETKLFTKKNVYLAKFDKSSVFNVCTVFILLNKKIPMVK